MASKRYATTLIFVFLILGKHTQGKVDFSSQEVIEAREKEGNQLYATCLQRVSFYDLPSNFLYKDITQKCLQSKDHLSFVVNSTKEQQRKIVLFSYPSDGYQVKAIISYTPEVESAPLLVFLRGGNNIFGLMHPANSYSCIKNYTILATAYRGGVSEGEDQFGGDEVDDVKNLVDFIPELENMLGIRIRPSKRYILGGSRGGMEMFLALQRYPYLQDWFDKGVCLSGLLDMRLTIAFRKDMKRMFVRHFGLDLEKNKEEWITRRNPIDHCGAIKKHFPILIIQGTEDTRVRLDEGRNMVKKLHGLGRDVTYREVEGAKHCLRDRIPERNAQIVQWLESE